MRVVARFAPLVVVIVSCTIAFSQELATVRGEVLRSFALPAADGMHYPTDVAVSADGTVFVADGVNGRVVAFRESGPPEFWTKLDGRALRNPVGLFADGRGQIWVADAGRGEVFAVDRGGLVTRVIGAALLGADVDVGDVAADERVVWITDNDRHQLLRVEGDQVRTIGRYGDSVGEFHYPFGVALESDGGLIVADGLNGRLQRLSPDGSFGGTISHYGVYPGQLYRAKDVAVDGEGRVWVSDSMLRVVQVFAADGRILGVLRDGAGAPLKFDAPVGIATRGGRLYVVEQAANRVVEIALTWDAATSTTTTPRAPSVGNGEQAQACTICHLEWIPPLSEGVSTELIAAPAEGRNSIEYVSREANCLSCHDGTVGDDRDKVWRAHGHGVGIAPPDAMTVPATLPLEDGKLACRTCHSAHASASRNTVETIVFLREAEAAADLCQQCHTEMDTGTANGMHPMAALDFEPLAAVGAHTDPGDAVTCLACHQSHGTNHDALLIASTERNELCLACHQPMSPALFGDDHRSKHGRLPMLNVSQRGVAAEWSRPLSSNDELLCTTCHQTHHAPQARALLAFDPRDDEACNACHVEQRPVIASAHDLRAVDLRIANRAGETAAESGVCSSCHMAHQPARVPNPTALDPGGACMTCHGSTGPLEIRLPDHNHPESACSACHSPHDPGPRAFLLDAPRGLCLECHGEMRRIEGGAHDLALQPDAWPSDSQSAADTCLACHRPHADESAGLWRKAPVVDRVARDGTCLACHENVLPDSPTAFALAHPRRGEAWQDPIAVPVAEVDGERYIACNSCHDPHHGPGEKQHMLRVEPDEVAEAVCIDCHKERANIHMIGHAEQPMAAAGFEVGACKPCHDTHATPGTLEAAIMWPQSLSQFPGAEDVPYADHYCLSCHRSDGPVAPPAIATHPEAPMLNTSSPRDANFLPLFNAAGEVDPQGSIGCRTCHLTHGRSEAAPIPRELASAGSRELRARQWHVRTFAGDNVCTSCHGFDGLRRFMYFHDVARRGGPIEGNLGAPQPARGR